MVALRVDSATFALPPGAEVLAACIGEDPGVQFGLGLAVLATLPPTRGCPRVYPLRVALLGQRAVRSPKAQARPARAPTAPEVREAVALLCDHLSAACPGAPWPAVACEDWFVGPNGLTVRDTARMFYFAEAAAQDLGLRFRAVPHGTWKLHALGTAGLKSDECARAYGRAALDLVGPGEPVLAERWAPSSGKPPSEADDAAALLVAHWYLSTEAAS